MPNVIRAWPLDENQKAIAAEFLGSTPSPAEQRAFEKGWRYAVDYEELAAEPEQYDPQSKEVRLRELERLGNKIVPANKQAAAPCHGAIHRLALEHIRQCGGVEHFNMEEFIREVRELPEVQRYYRQAGRSQPLSGNAIRKVLKDRLGIVGNPGRKKTA